MKDGTASQSKMVGIGILKAKDGMEMIKREGWEV